VLGQAHTPRRRFLPIVAIVLITLAAPAAGGADPSHTTSSLRAHDAQLAAKSRAAVLGLYSLDQQLSGAQSKLAALQNATVALRAEETSLALQLSIARRGAAVAQRRLGTRLRVLYEQGNVEPLEIVFGAKSLDEALSNLDNLSRASGQGEDVLRQLKAARTHIVAARSALANRRAALARATEQARATAASLEQARAARSAYLGSLASQRRLTQQQIGSLVAQAQAAQLRSRHVVRTITVDSSVATTFSPAASTAIQSAPSTSGAATGARTITVTATGYSLGGTTSTGLRVGWGVAAVDPSLIPLGSHMTVPGYGEAVAADTGGAVVGATIDLWFPTIAQANAWGRRTVTLVVH
jgi:peptidoglycan DL-endopeptidase CwlO